jgi:hypothetical protein
MALMGWTHPEHCYYGYVYEDTFRNEKANSSRYDECNQQAYQSFIGIIDKASQISDCRNAVLALGRVDPLWAAHKIESTSKKTYRWSILEKLEKKSPPLCKRYFNFINQVRSCNGIARSLQNNYDIHGDDADILAYIILRSAYPVYSKPTPKNPVVFTKEYHKLANGLLSTYLTQLRLKNTQVNCYKSIKDQGIKDKGKHFLTSLLLNKRNKNHTKVYFNYILNPPIANIEETCLPRKYPSRRVCFYSQLISHYNIESEENCHSIAGAKRYGLCMYHAMKSMASLVIDNDENIISGYNHLDDLMRIAQDKKNKKKYLCPKLTTHYNKIKESNPYVPNDRKNKQRCQKISGINNNKMTMRCIAGFSRQYANYDYARKIFTKLNCR